MEEQEAGRCPEESPEDPQPIVDFGSSVIRSRRGTIHVLTIVGQIEGHQILPPTSKSTKYEHVMPLLASVEESDEVDGLLEMSSEMASPASMSPWYWAAGIPSGCPWRCRPRSPSSRPPRP